MGQIVPCFLPSTRLQEPADLRDFHFTHDSVCTTSSRGCVSTRLHGKHRRRGSCVHGAPRQHYEQHGAARISAPGHASVSRQDPALSDVWRTYLRTSVSRQKGIHVMFWRSRMSFFTTSRPPMRFRYQCQTLITGRSLCPTHPVSYTHLTLPTKA